MTTKVLAQQAHIPAGAYSDARYLRERTSLAYAECLRLVCTMTEAQIDRLLAERKALP